jgi:4,5-DOPA dioxygenase extradiol
MGVSMRRRDVLAALAAAPLLPLGCARPEPTMTTTSRMPALFVAHGAPILLDDAAWVAELGAWAAALPRPRAILIVSAHWEHRPIAIGATRPLPLIYDFGGFPEKFYRLTYASPGAPELAARVRALLGGAGVPFVDEPERGLDHGAYVPLMCMAPAADVPVLQLSLPSLAGPEVFRVGRALAPLRDEGVLIVGSGFLTHNLRFAFGGGTPAWAREFDGWAEGALARGDVDALVDFEAKAPALRQNLPTTEHFVPLLVALGAAGDDVARATQPIAGFWLDGCLTRRSAQFG